MMVKFGIPLGYEKKAELSEKHKDSSGEYEGLIKKAVREKEKPKLKEKIGDTANARV
jgi:hypothetical protein